MALPGAGDPSTDLLRRWQEHADADALNQLLQREVGVLKEMVHGRLTGGLAGSAGTSDVAQEAVLGLLQVKEAPSFEDPKALRAYLWRSAWHLLAKRYARREKIPLDLESSPAAETVFKNAPAFASIERGERAVAISLAMGLLG